MERFNKPSNKVMYLVLLATTIVFLVDFFVPLGRNIATFYIIPVAIAAFSHRSSLPLWAAAFATVLTVLGIFDTFNLQPPVAGTVANPAINRSISVLTIWVMAFFGRQFIVNRLLAQDRMWISNSLTQLSELTLNDPDTRTLCQNVLNYHSRLLKAPFGTLYVRTRKGDQLIRLGSLGLGPEDEKRLSELKMGETLIGQAAQSRNPIELHNVPADYVRLQSGLGATPPRHLLIMPSIHGNQVRAVLELGFLTPPPPQALEFMSTSSEAIAAAVESAQYREHLKEVLAETQQLAQELQAQQEELRVTNEELEEQAKVLKDTQMRLEAQHAELEQTNEQLEEQTQLLEQQKEETEKRSEALLLSKRDLEQKTLELARAGQYKSEFLANMSHELRTPLNSSLILARLLSENKPGNLNPEQVDYARTIYEAGNDLLTLINDVLDLAKVEAGRLEVTPEEVGVETLLKGLEKEFSPLAESKNLTLVTDIAPETPSTFFGDPQRVRQVIKNFLSNAIKFTDAGSITLRARVAEQPPLANGINASDRWLALSVQDTGIGIPVDQQSVIFEAFRQADGTTSRKHGGTGLGLSISRDLARLIGGTIEVKSEPGHGSTFILILPERFEAPTTQPETIGLKPEPIQSMETQGPIPTIQAPVGVTLPPSSNLKSDIHRPKNPSSRIEPSTDDRHNLTGTDRVLLIIEDDPRFAKVLLNAAHARQFKALLADTAEKALELAQTYPVSAILLDIRLPDHSGLYVLERLKQDGRTRHIPVHMVSAHDHSQAALHMGAVGYLQKPFEIEELEVAFGRLEEKLNQDMKRVLVVEDDRVQRESICRLINDRGIDCVSTEAGTQALERLQSETFDCMITDLSLPDMSGFELLERMSSDESHSKPPVIVYTGRSLTNEEENQLRRYSQSVIIKGARSPERLLNEVTLFLHRVESNLSPERQKMLQQFRNRERIFDSRGILVVDDDVRNVFALTSILEQKGAKVEIARNGLEALRKLEQNPSIDLVLMDIMMPVMDGYETMREIRKRPELARLPIIAVTAKAMRDDQELCLKAGANDYLAKPIDVDKLLSLIRVWMPEVGRA